MYVQSQGSSGGNGQLWAAGGAGAAAGAGATLAAMSYKKTASRATAGLVLGGIALGTQVLGGNSNQTIANNMATQVNTINALAFDAAPTGAQVAALRAQVAVLAGNSAQGFGNTNPLQTLGLQQAPSIPAPNTGLPAVAAVSTTSSSGLGNVGILLLGGVLLYMAVKD